MSKLEIWLCRVLCHPHGAAMNTSELKPESHQLVMAKIINGELGCLRDGTIIEPVSAHASEPLAHEARLRAIADSPRDDFRVVVTMQVGA